MHNHGSMESAKARNMRPSSRRVRNPYSERQRYDLKASQNPVISGYFVREKSYKEIVISRINAFLCCLLAFLVLVCLVSYYFVVDSELQLRKLSKETITLNYDNVDMQNRLDNLQSLSNVEKQVSRLNVLQRAKQVIELPAANLPSVDFDKTPNSSAVNRFLGY